MLALILITDGIVEARNKAGELFGFERAAKLSSERAKQIAETAQSFGQEDDITVDAVACPGRGGPLNSSLASPSE
jgi:serine/threonine protein phosphatase PrpC